MRTATNASKIWKSGSYARSGDWKATGRYWSRNFLNAKRAKWPSHLSAAFWTFMSTAPCSKRRKNAGDETISRHSYRLILLPRSVNEVFRLFKPCGRSAGLSDWLAPTSQYSKTPENTASNVHGGLKTASDHGAPIQSRPMSNAAAECVSAPTLMRSTPVAAMSAIVASVTPPEASSTTCGASSDRN